MAHDIPIWEVARATSAAPTYFKPIKIDGLEYIDGGFGKNNPCMEIYDEVQRMNNHCNTCTKLILSIGTGKNNKGSRFDGRGLSRYINQFNIVRKWATDPEDTHSSMQKAKKSGNFEYFRFNVEEGLGQMKLDQWRARGRMRIKIGNVVGKFRCPKVKPADKTNTVARISLAVEEKANGSLSEVGIAITNRMETPPEHQNGHPQDTQLLQQSQISNTRILDSSSAIPQWFRPKNKTLDTMRERTREYLDEKLKKDIEQCATLLVEARRNRAKNDPQRWEKACFGAWYQCVTSGCQRGEKEYDNEHAMRKHLLDKHSDLYPRGPEGKASLEKALDTCKIIVY